MGTKREAHWIEKCEDASILPNAGGSLGLTLQGGSEFSQFVFLGPLNESEVNFQHGHLQNGDVILEVQGQKVVGFTQGDVAGLLRMCSKSPPVAIRVCKNFLTKNLKEYLAMRFAKGSIDSELQNQIRENLYQRTVPCTTRKPRDGEVNGQDYWFLTLDQFEELERAGLFLECGVFNDNCYGTPSPGADLFSVIENIPNEHTLNPSVHHTPSRKMTPKEKRQRNRSNVEAMMPPTSERDIYESQQSGDMSVNDSNNSYTYPSRRENYRGRMALDDSDMHLYDEANQENQNQDGYSTFPRRKPANQARGVGLSAESPSMFEPSYQNAVYRDSSMTGRLPRSLHELQGEMVETVLLKGDRGLGVTIIGGENNDPLQIKSIVPGGPAEYDGQLQAGDILVYVNDTNVMDFTHDEVIEMFQSIRVGNRVRLVACRGYPLFADEDDSRNEFVRTFALQGEGGAALPNGNVASGNNGSITSSNDDKSLHTIRIVRGNSGFGFTIENSSTGYQKVKKISDTTRCGEMRENDLLVQINGENLRQMSHTEVVSFLKSFGTGEEAIFHVLRPKSKKGLFAAMSSPRGSRSSSNHPAGKKKSSFFSLFGSKNKKSSEDSSRRSGQSGSPAPGEYDGSENNTLSEDTIPAQQQAHRVPNFERNQLPYSSFSKIITPAFIPASQYARDMQRNSIREHDARDPALRNNLNSRTYNNTYEFNDEAKNYNEREIVSPQRISPSKDIALQQQQQQQRLAYEAQDVIQQQARSSHQNTPVNVRRFSRPDETLQPALGDKGRSSDLQDYDRPNAYQPPVSNLSRNFEDESNSEALREAPTYIDLCVPLRRDENGFGFRVVGGGEEGTQVSVGHIVPKGAAEADGRLQTGDEILSVDGESTVGAAHQDTVGAIQRAAENGYVVLGIRRRFEASSGNNNNLSSAELSTPNSMQIESSKHSKFTNGDNLRHVTITRRVDEGFGFVLVSSMANNACLDTGIESGRYSSYPVIGRILPNSPAENCGRVEVGDRLLQVNSIDVINYQHKDIVSMIKNSGLSVMLTLACGDETSLTDMNENEARAGSELNGQAHIMRHEVVSPAARKAYANNVHQSPANRSMPRDVTTSNTPPRATQDLHHGQEHNDIDDDEDQAAQAGALLLNTEYDEVLLEKGPKGFGFSIRGGKEFHNMPLFILKIAEDGPAYGSNRLRVGDEIIEINGCNTRHLTHSDAIELIRKGGNTVSLLLKRRVGEENSQAVLQPSGLPETSAAIRSR